MTDDAASPFIPNKVGVLGCGRGAYLKQMTGSTVAVSAPKTHLLNGESEYVSLVADLGGILCPVNQVPDLRPWSSEADSTSMNGERG